MGHEHGVFDSDTHFSINPITREVTNVTSKKVILIQGDHNSERFTFDIPRLVEGHDMGDCSRVEIHYLNVDAKTKEQNTGFYTVDDLKTDGETVSCSWLISSNCTQLVGSLSFMLKYICAVGGVVGYVWGTAVNSNTFISTGIDAAETFEVEYVDVIEQWKESVMQNFEDDLTAWKDAKATELEADLTGWKESEEQEIQQLFGDYTDYWDKQIAAERARIDSFVALKDGSTTGDAELQDIRIGADGVTYDSAGTAVREQFANVSDALAFAKVDYTETLAEISGQYIQVTGKIFGNESYSISEPITVPGGYTVEFTARGYKTQVAMISEMDADGNYVSLVASVDSTERLYSYTTESEANLVFTWNNVHAHSLRIRANVANVVDAVNKRADEGDNNVAIEAAEMLADAEANRIAADYVSLSVFPTFGVVGDSYASGEVYFGDSFHDIYKISWGQILARKLGTSCVNFSKGGLSTKGWLTNSKGLPLMLATDPQDIYYFALGINDANYYGVDYLGSVEDICEDYTQNPDTFYGNYGRIIANVKEHAPQAKLVMFTMVPTTDTKATFNVAIAEIATHFGIPCVTQMDDQFFSSEFYENGKVQSHPVAIVYSGMANAFERLLKKCIIENYDYFADAFMY